MIADIFCIMSMSIKVNISMQRVSEINSMQMGSELFRMTKYMLKISIIILCTRLGSGHLELGISKRE